MEIKLIIGNPVHTPIDQFELVVSYMHGDADGDSSKDFIYDNSEEGVEQLKLALAAIDTINDLDDCEDELLQLFRDRGMSDNDAADSADTMRDNFYEGDCTCDGSRAAQIDGFEVFFYDNHGVKHNVKIEKQY